MCRAVYTSRHNCHQHSHTHTHTHSQILVRAQALYFDRYTRLLAPELNPLRDSRVSFPRSAQEAMEGRGVGGRGGRKAGLDDNDVIDIQLPR